jgi:hypothetical protein
MKIAIEVVLMLGVMLLASLKAPLFTATAGMVFLIGFFLFVIVGSMRHRGSSRRGASKA